MLVDLQGKFEEKAFQESEYVLPAQRWLYPGDFYKLDHKFFKNFGKGYPESES